MPLTHDEKFLLNWLSEEDFSSYGECRGRALDRLIEQGLAAVTRPAPDPDYGRVSLTEAGWALVQG